MNITRPRPLLCLEWALLGLLLALFLGLGTRQFPRPGLAHPEALDPACGMELALDLPRTYYCYTDWSMSLAGRTWPLRLSHPYDFNAFDIYWSALAFKIAGVSVSVLRLSELALSAATLIIFCALCRLWLGSAAAFGAGLLLAVNPAFLIESRIDYWAIELELALPAVATLALFSVWHRTRRVWALYAGAFVWGGATCVTTKAVAFLLAYPLLYLAAVPRKDFPSRRQAAVAAACAALGAADFLGFNFFRGMAIFKFLLDALRAPTGGGVDNFDLANNFSIRWGQLIEALNASLIFKGQGPAGTQDWVFPIFFFAAFAALTWRCAARKPFPGRGFIVIILGLLPLLLLETIFTPWALDPQHVLVLWPYTILIVAAGLDWVRSGIEARLPGKGLPVAAVLLALLVGSALHVDANYFSRLAANGGIGPWSGAIEDLAVYLDQNGLRKPFSLSVEIAPPVSIITGGRVTPLIAWEVDRTITPRLLGVFERIAGVPGARFLSLSPGLTDSPLRKRATSDELAILGAFRSIVEKSGHRLVAVRVFPERPAQPIYVVWRVD
jgi:hypothetical protein